MKTDYFKHLVAATALLLVAGVSIAHDVEVDGIYYNLVAKAKQATVTYQGENSGSAAYSGSVSIPPTIESGGVTYNVTSIGHCAFSNCFGLTSITIPSSVTSIGMEAFYICSGLTSITIPSCLTSIGENAFAGCTGLTSITIPSSVTSIGHWAFQNCPGITSITIPSSVTSIGEGVFELCSGLTSITIPLSVTSIGNFAFQNCSSLTSITIPSSVTSIGSRAFRNCSSLTSVIIEGTDYLNIGSQAFYGLDKLKTVTLHGGDFGSQAFANCPDLTDVYNYGYYDGSLGYATSDVFEGSYIDYVTLHVPSELLSQAQSTEPWNQFGTLTTIDPIVYPTTASLTDGEKFDGYLKDADMNSISYTRTFNNTEWQALYLPFEMSYSDWSTDFDVARINDVHQFDDDDDGTIDRTTLEVIKMKSGSTTEANTPYLIKAKTTGEKTITVSNTKLYRAQEKQYDVSSWRTCYNFCSTYSPLTASELNQTGYLVLSGGTLCPIDPAGSGLSSYRWYLKITDRDGTPKDYTSEVKLRVLDADGTTVLEDVELAKEAREPQVYDLSGRRVDSSKVSNGIYIINGKKVFVK